MPIKKGPMVYPGPLQKDFYFSLGLKVSETELIQ